ncbi:MAG: hypothetical protein C4530_24715 [Desulfobacteraceae bacterium]|nr:MAG: hypothetical protein C4530_24715 [Desulfobacteraceae bacterium]
MNALSTLSESEKSALFEGIAAGSKLFWGPETVHCEELIQKGFLSEIHAVRLSLAVDPPDSLEEVNRIIAGFSSGRDLFEYLETAYVQLFISNRKIPVVPLYHSCYEYENAPLMGAPAAMMQKRLADAGLSLGAHIHEPPDHLCIELEYLYFMGTVGGSEANGSRMSEAAVFARRMMLPWIYKLRDRLAAHPESRFYLPAISLILSMLQRIGGTSDESSEIVIEHSC